jgi:hypothetical protein
MPRGCTSTLHYGISSEKQRIHRGAGIHLILTRQAFYPIQVRPGVSHSTGDIQSTDLSVTNLRRSFTFPNRNTLNYC